jgi:ATP-dependent Lhr-like helicase
MIFCATQSQCSFKILCCTLINNFGKKALTVLSGYGIGVETAARILRNYVDDENVFKSVYNAERQYVTTRAFWKD